MSDDKAICEEALEVIRAIVEEYDAHIATSSGTMLEALIHEQYGVERVRDVIIGCMERRAATHVEKVASGSTTVFQCDERGATVHVDGVAVKSQSDTTITKRRRAAK